MINGIKLDPKSNRLFGQVLRGMYGINRKKLWQQPFEIRNSIRAVVYDVMSALMYGSASRPPNNDPLSDQ